MREKILDFDVVVVGSGFGGAVSALRLTEKGYKVAVLEAGPRFTDDTLPKSNWNARRFFHSPLLGLKGIMRMTPLRHAIVLSGAGVGGGSLVYGNTLCMPPEQFYRDPGWSQLADWQEELAPHLDQAKRMLGAATANATTACDSLLRKIASNLGVEESFSPTHVGVFLGEPGKSVPDPYFGGAGPQRKGCIECGGCMVGCRFGAKNDLRSNYLYLAEQGGASIFANMTALDVRPVAGHRYLVSGPAGRWRGDRFRFRAPEVIFAAGVLGTLKLLLRMKSSGILPRLSDRLGDRVRTNSEAIVGASAPKVGAQDYSQGVAITSVIAPDDDTHIEVCRYPKGSNAMANVVAVIADDVPGESRWYTALRVIARDPVTFLRSRWVKRWSERSVMLLVMQKCDSWFRLEFRSGPLGGRLVSKPGDSARIPSSIPVAQKAARIAAKTLGGTAGNSWAEILFGISTTAHIIGGAPVGASSDDGVVDAYHRVFGHPGLHIVDGSIVGSNLGVNPSLTITALAERALSMWPNRGETDLRPKMGEKSLGSLRTLPNNPAVPGDAPAALFETAPTPELNQETRDGNLD